MTVPEVTAVLWYIADELKAQTPTIYEKIVEVDRATRGLSYDKRFKTGLWCPILVDNLCTVYPVRPFACRIIHSFDSDLCRLGYGELRVIPIPRWGNIERKTLTLAAGLTASLIQRGVTYAGQVVEFVAALRIAMELPDCIDRWLEGENVFVEAEVQQGEEHAKIVDYHRKVVWGECVQDESIEETLPRQIREKILMLASEMRKSRHLLK